MCVKPSVAFRTNRKIRNNNIAEIYTPCAGVSKGGGRAAFEGGPFFHPTSGSEICRSIFDKLVRRPASLQIDFHLFGRLNGIEKNVMISLSLFAKCRSLSQS